jgi:hypothetical protein
LIIKAHPQAVNIDRWIMGNLVTNVTHIEMTSEARPKPLDATIQIARNIA